MRKDSTRKPPWEGILSVRSSELLRNLKIDTLAKLKRTAAGQLEELLGPTANSEVREWLAEHTAEPQAPYRVATMQDAEHLFNGNEKKAAVWLGGYETGAGEAVGELECEIIKAMLSRSHHYDLLRVVAEAVKATEADHSAASSIEALADALRDKPLTKDHYIPVSMMEFVRQVRGQ